MTKVLIATDKPFAPVAVNGIREIVEAQGYELVLLEKYTSQDELIRLILHGRYVCTARNHGTF